MLSLSRKDKFESADGIEEDVTNTVVIVHGKMEEVTIIVKLFNAKKKKVAKQLKVLIA